MKAIGYVTCLECEGLYRGYAPRHWKKGEELCAWQHTLEDGWGAKCPGSYKPGKCSRLDEDSNFGRTDLIGSIQTAGALNTLTGIAGKLVR